MGKSEDGYWGCGCLIFIVAVFLASIFSAVSERRARKERKLFVQDSIILAEERDKHIRDSIMNTKEYKDSVRIKREMYKDMCRLEDSISSSNTIVITCDDGKYHYYTKCDEVLEYIDVDDGIPHDVYLPRVYDAMEFRYTKNKNRYRLTTEDEMEELGYESCYLCY